MAFGVDYYNQRLEDGGPVYMETHTGQFIVEPWNAVSSLLMLVPAFYWLYRIRHETGRYRMLVFCIALVATGGLGSALFHGFRVSRFFLFMDVLPSAILTLTLSVFFWIRVLKKWWYVLLILLPLFGIRFIFWGNLPEHTAINLSYFITGLTVSLPLLILLIKSQFYHWKLVAFGIVSFGSALLFRQLDAVPNDLLPMGTHFLWHSFSAIGAYFILAYLYNLLNRTPQEIKYGQITS